MSTEWILNSITCQQDSLTGTYAETVGSLSSSGMGTQEDRIPTVPTGRGRAGELPVGKVHFNTLEA